MSKRGGGAGELADPVAGAARGLVADDGRESVEDTLRRIVAGALACVPHVDRAGISYVEQDGVISSRAPSDEVAAELDALQNTLDEGPCLESLRTGRRVVVDMTTAGVERWPRFAPVALQHGTSAMCSLALYGRRDARVATLNLYSRRAGAFDDAAVAMAALFSSHAALALHTAQRLERMTDALTRRDLIGQAKGILAERFSVSDDEAFAMLVESSQTTQLKLHAVAEWLVSETHHRQARPESS